MTIHQVTWDTFDVWYTPRGHLFLEERCIDAIVDRFRSRFGEANIRVNQLPERLASSYCAIQPECVIVQHVLSGQWCVWSTNDHIAYVLFTTLFGRLPDARFYGAGFWNWRPANLLCAYLPNAPLPAWRAFLAARNVEVMLDRMTLDEWLTPDRFPLCPYPGQTISLEEVDKIRAATLDPQPYLLFRGFLWQKRLPFVRHLRDLATSRGLKEVVLISTRSYAELAEADHAPFNLESLPDFSRVQGEVPYGGYLREIALATASLSLPGTNDVSRRDQESLAVGVPVIRPEMTIDLWGLDDCPALIETTRCMEFACDQHFNWRLMDDELVRQSCVEMIDQGLALIEDRERLSLLKREARAWFDKYCRPEPVAAYIADGMLARFERELLNSPRYEGVLNS